MMISVIHDTRDVARTRQRGLANILICFSSPGHPSSVECFSDMNPFKVLMMSVNGEQNSTQASIIINMYERIDKGQTVGFIKL